VRRNRFLGLLLATTLASSGIGVSAGSVSAQPTLTIEPFARTFGSVLSRDGNWAVGMSGLVAVNTGFPAGVAGMLEGLALDDSGKYVAMLKDGGILVRRTISDGTEVPLSVPGPTGAYFGFVDTASHSADGTKVAYQIPAPTGSGKVVMVGPVGGAAVDATMGLTRRGFARAQDVSMSADGRYATFAWVEKEFICLVPSSASCDSSIQRYDTATKTLERVDVDPDRSTSPAFVRSPAISDDGRFVAFISDSTTLAQGLSTRNTRVYLRDMVRKQTWLLAEPANTNSTIDTLKMSGDGRRIVTNDVFTTTGSPSGVPTIVSSTRLIDLNDGSSALLGGFVGVSSLGGTSPFHVNRRGDVILVDLIPGIGPPSAYNANRLLVPLTPGNASTIVLPFDGTVDLTIPVAAPSTITINRVFQTFSSREIVSRDGSRILGESSMSSLITVASGHATMLPGGYRPITLDETGRYVLAEQSAGVVVRRNMTTGAELALPVPPLGVLGAELIGPVQIVDGERNPGAVLSADGSVAAYMTSADPAIGQVFVTAFDGKPVEATVGLPNTSSNVRASTLALSADGRYVTFVWMHFLVGCSIPGPQCAFGVYRFDRVTGDRKRVDVNPDGSVTDAFVSTPVVSDDGRFVTFTSNSQSLVAGLVGIKPRIFQRDMQTGRTRLVAETGLPYVSAARLNTSGDGRRIFYVDQIPQTFPSVPLQVLRLVDLSDGSTTTVNAYAGGLPNGDSFAPFINRVGDTLLFHSGATNLVFPVAASDRSYRALLQPSANAGLMKFPSGETFDPLAFLPASPIRAVDTRSANGTKPGDGATVEVTVPDGAAAAVLNVTGLEASDAGYVTVFPCGETRPNVSNLNLVPGVVSPNLVISKVGANGKVCIFTEKSSNVFADVAGVFPVGSSLTAQTPVRVLDTRSGAPVNYLGSKPAAGATVEVPIPAGAAAAVLNVTGLDAADAGFVTVYPCGEQRPNASNLNLVPDVVSPNLVISKVGANGRVCIFTEKSANIFADLAGTFSS
jgi:Tol biopolymer transport system component